MPTRWPPCRRPVEAPPTCSRTARRHNTDGHRPGNPRRPGPATPPRGRGPARPGPVPQPRTVAAGFQLARAGPGPGSEGAAAGAAALPVHLLHQPGRVLRDPHGHRAPCRGPGPAGARRRHRPGAVAGADPRARGRTGRCPVPLLEPDAAAAAGRRRDRHPGPHQLERAPAALAAGLVPQQRDPGAVAAGSGPFASIPAHPQQVAQRGGGAGRQGRIRPPRPSGDRARTALAQPHRAAAAEPGRQGTPGLRAAVLAAGRLRRRTVPGHDRARRLPVPGHPQFGPGGGRGRSGQPGLGPAHRTGRSRLPAGGAVGDRPRLPQADRAHPAAELRTGRERGLLHRRPGQPEPGDPGP